MYVCVVHNPGVSLNPVSYQLHLAWEYNQTTLNAKERAVAQQLFDRWGGGWGLGWAWMVLAWFLNRSCLLLLSAGSAWQANAAL